MACVVRAYVRQYRRKYPDRCEERWADTHIHGATTRRIAAMFAEEHPALLSAAPGARERSQSTRIEKDGAFTVEHGLDYVPAD
jgi:hypothetical protein